MKRSLNRRKAVLIAIFGGIMLAVTAALAVQSMRARNFMKVRGVVVASGVEHRGRSYHAIIEYRYVVGGKEYKSAEFGPTGNSGTSEWADAAVGLHPPTAACTVLYNPNSPGDAVLAQWPRTGDIAVLILCAVLGLIQLVCGVAYLRMHPALARVQSRQVS